jgi:ABC-type antimicrobial peptide transport system permease subunit
MLAPASRPARNYQVVARIRAGATVEQAREDLAAIVSRFPDKSLRNSVATLQESLVGDVRPGLLILLGVAALVLLIGCGNVATLLLARSAARDREVAIRTALGATRQTLLKQFLIESLMLALTGGAAGLLLSIWGINILRAAWCRHDSPVI